MGIKERIARFLVKYDLIPVRIRWKKSVSGFGTIYKDIYRMLNKKRKKDLTILMFKEGFVKADETIKELGLNKGLKDCAIALMAFHRIFGIKSHISEEKERELRIRVTDCMWLNKRGWSPEICASLSAFEAGLIKGINKKIHHVYTKRRSLGHDYCEIVLSYRKVKWSYGKR
jgi:predicted hydrocarbon binding protein